jgi:hypothetical protein
MFEKLKEFTAGIHAANAVRHGVQPPAGAFLRGGPAPLTKRSGSADRKRPEAALREGSAVW